MAARRFAIGGVRNPRELIAGLVLVAVAVAAFWLGQDLAMGRMTRPGPGYVPRLLAVLTGLFGIAVCTRAWTTERSGPVRWNLRGVALILGAILLFALLLKGFGFGVASLALLLTASLASPDFKPIQAVLFASR